ncbi:MAG: hypothetical protein QW662_06525, partial [Nitrososphaerota archaeon]
MPNVIARIKGSSNAMCPSAAMKPAYLPALRETFIVAKRRGPGARAPEAETKTTRRKSWRTSKEAQ